MPLTGTEKTLAKKISTALKTGDDWEKNWEIVIKDLLDHLKKNAVVTGTCPPSGGQLTGGRIT